ncbi:dihydroneopterin aldolase [Stagnimonas aquatica]|uniref:7,8-dihydroneopterin aldolase n=1 Tax=Stagnimonas aquatica TaxID=2689987 RepID=A0A3N0VK79_9GAMM|nr:dihydroneopterin aldolase [Stagnimonas aquatica]ROH93167.1 dihydroneopterin aldolase [Stagnimonas aquatica]TAJ52749.1 MAG: dihydroneopterin aldolase [Nevskiaceae bacterium]TAM26380.1 MAG: dihydroneopterin aldolase [Nevskiaceae bacterium]
MDKVFIRQLEIQTHIGVHAWEHHIRRPLILDLDLGVDTREAAASDHIRDALDYKAVCDAIERLVRERQFQLLETFAESAARRLFEEFPLLSLRLSVSKPGAVTAARTVGVEIERRREDYAVCGRGGV